MLSTKMFVSEYTNCSVPITLTVKNLMFTSQCLSSRRSQRPFVASCTFFYGAVLLTAPLVRCPQLLIQYVNNRCCPLNLEVVPCNRKDRTRHAVLKRDLLNMELTLQN